MINLEFETLHIPGQLVQCITSYQVWWLGPTGLLLDLDTVKKAAKVLGIEDIAFAFKAVPVAVGENGGYEEIR